MPRRSARGGEPAARPRPLAQSAEKLAPAKAGIVAFSTAGDAELGEYDDEPTVIFKSGSLPHPFGDA
jgi:hypothetical protein